MANESLRFKKGPHSRLPDTKEAGSILFETDTGSLFVDTSDSSRIQVKDPTKLPLTGGEITGSLTVSQSVTAQTFVGNLEGNATNADNLDGKSSSDFINYLGEITDVTNILNNPKYSDCPYEGIISSEVATSIGLSSEIDTEWNIKCFRATEGSGFQIAVPIYYNEEPPKYRIAHKYPLNGSAYQISWGKWNNFSDGGNAELFRGNSINKFLKYNGVATDCNECTTRGVYQASESTLNIPSGVLLSSLYTPILFVVDEACQLFFTGVEVYKRSGTPLDGGSRLDWKSWTNVASGGNADTLDGKHAESFSQNLGTWRTGSVKDLILAASSSGFVFINNTVTDMPVDNGYWFGVLDCNTVHRCLRITTIGSSAGAYTITYNADNAKWSDWHNIADGGNANKVNNKTATDIMKLDYDLSTRTEISSTSESPVNLNNITTGGCYVIKMDSIAATIANTPWTTSGYFLNVYRNSSSYVVQIAMTWGGIIKKRSLAGTTWSNWAEIVDTQKLVSGTAIATTSNCPDGAWYGQYEEV